MRAFVFRIAGIVTVNVPGASIFLEIKEEIQNIKKYQAPPYFHHWKHTYTPMSLQDTICIPK
jgi:hypothetical protein